MDRTRLIELMMDHQDMLNRSIYEDWKMRNFNWPRAIWLKCAGFVEACDWKWWNKKEENPAHKKIELADIWHFMLSWALLWSLQPDTVYFYWYEGYSHPTDLSEVEVAEKIAEHALKRELVPTFLYFGDLCCKVGVNIEDLAKLYFGKNVLNDFRQKKGYKKGKYRKVWRVQGDANDTWITKEDSEIMVELVEKAELSDVNEFFVKLFLELERVYFLAGASNE